MQQYVSVSSLNKYLKAKFTQDPHLQVIYLKGELSNVKKHPSGHYYFTLKDENARVSAVMFARDQVGLSFELQDGAQVLIEGSVAVFENAGTYQVYVKRIKMDGYGALFVLYEKLKKQMEAEGLFEQKFKKKLKKYPKKIAIISASSGAAIHDILTTLKRRYPICEITLFSSLVQGPNAALQIVERIQLIDQLDYDVLIIARGGGSIEDLWAFNQENVCRAIFNANVPIVSAIGHETDFTIADFVSDLRAPTPTAAAELVTPNYLEIQDSLIKIQAYLKTKIIQKHQILLSQLSQYQQHYILNNPLLLVSNRQMQLDLQIQQLSRQQSIFVQQQKERLYNNINKIQKINEQKILNYKNMIVSEEYLRMLINKKTDNAKLLLKHNMESLNHLSPMNVLLRGYSIASCNDKIVNSIDEIVSGDAIEIKVSNGTIKTNVKEVISDAKKD